MILDFEAINAKSFYLKNLANRLRTDADIVFKSLSNVKWKGDAGSVYSNQLGIYYAELKANADELDAAADKVRRHAYKILENNETEILKNSKKEILKSN
ncbi:MAG: hypothetical protein LBT85_02000 [Bifidobacteriaceae bacterium]|jgi:uncharacterized protein YukE|nr:hypothetical protein [Bifidobacteriaceae bacterium]